MSACRGSDITDETLFPNSSMWKNVVTARVRAIVFTAQGVQGAKHNVNPLTQPDVDKIKALNQRMTLDQYTRNFHYIDHLDKAVVATRTHPVWGGLANSLRTAMSKPVNSEANARKEAERTTAAKT